MGMIASMIDVSGTFSYPKLVMVIGVGMFLIIVRGWLHFGHLCSPCITLTGYLCERYPFLFSYKPKAAWAHALCGTLRREGLLSTILILLFPDTEHPAATWFIL